MTNNICPINCKIVKNAIKAHEQSGAIMGEYVDYHKKHCTFCHLCIRNEYADKSLSHLMSDKSDEK